MLSEIALKSLSTLPLANTLDTVGVAAVGEDSETMLGRVGFLTGHLHCRSHTPDPYCDAQKKRANAPSLSRLYVLWPVDSIHQV